LCVINLPSLQKTHPLSHLAIKVYRFRLVSSLFRQSFGRIMLVALANMRVSVQARKRA
jgi:hypothetical protein